LSKYDSNKDKKLSFGEIISALEDEGVVSFAMQPEVLRNDPLEQNLQQVADWIMTNYDTNKDGQLD
jgi:hypothetical protein